MRPVACQYRGGTLFQAEEDAVKHAEELVAQLSAEVEQLEEENPDTLDDTAARLKKTLKELQHSDPDNEDVAVIKQYFVKCDALKAAKKQTKEAIAKLTKLVVEKYPLLTVDEIKGHGDQREMAHRYCGWCH